MTRYFLSWSYYLFDNIFTNNIHTLLMFIGMKSLILKKKQFFITIEKKIWDDYLDYQLDLNNKCLLLQEYIIIILQSQFCSSIRSINCIQ